MHSSVIWDALQPQSWGPYAIAMAAAVVIPFTLTLIIGKSKGIDKVAEQTGREQAMAEAAAQAKQISENEKKPVSLKAFLDGKTVPMNEVPDQVFASLALGNGIAIEPTSNVLKAPADGTVTVTMDESNHAVGLTLKNGVEVLLHIGLDTVNMKGDGFTPLVKMGDSVKAGQDLIEISSTIRTRQSAQAPTQSPTSGDVHSLSRSGRAMPVRSRHIEAETVTDYEKTVRTASGLTYRKGGAAEVRFSIL